MDAGGADAQISGWGYIKKVLSDQPLEKMTDNMYSRQLKLTTIQIIDREKCKRIYVGNPSPYSYAAHDSIFW